MMKLNLLEIPQHLITSEEFLLGKTYQFIKKVKESKTTAIFQIEGKQDQISYYLKISKNQSNLEQEAKILNIYGGYPGFPSLIKLKNCSQFSYIISQKLGPNLEELKEKCGGKFNLITCCKLAIELLGVIQLLHKSSIIHSCINPFNILSGEGNATNKIYLIGFGNAKILRKAQDGKQDFSSINFSSIHAQESKLLDKRNDLISLCYLFAYLYRGYLPWINDKYEANQELILDKKKKFSMAAFCSDLPKEIIELFAEINSLQFGSEPEYDKYKKLLQKILEAQTFKNITKQNYQWISIINPKIESYKIKTKKVQNKLLGLVDHEVKQILSSKSSFATDSVESDESLDENLQLEQVMQKLKSQPTKFLSYIKIQTKS